MWLAIVPPHLWRTGRGLEEGGHEGKGSYVEKVGGGESWDVEVGAGAPKRS